MPRVRVAAMRDLLSCEKRNTDQRRRVLQA
jgi:hypothetical protein